MVDCIRDRDNHGNTAADCTEQCQNNELAKWIRRHASVEMSAIEVLQLQRERNSSISLIIFIRSAAQTL